ncbi:NAD(P)/FAD-dependent oxidoreductase [Kitasatospora sp. NPDC052896]|uniref:NAD(P)/FAD-dependent oxidoreductase n=1 Tax=Kitasatospora sp. NPDC052896 TaxID=3364061 RepID=UPI0037C6097D
MTEVDIAVVGGGIIGCLTAREIHSRAPELSVAVLDRDAVGAGASRRSAGLHFPRGSTERVRRMAAYSQDYYAELLGRHPELPIHRLAMSVVARSGSLVRENFLDSAKPTETAGLPGGLVEVPADAGVWEVEGGQYADVHGLSRGLLRELRPQVEVHEGIEVTALRLGPEEIVLQLGPEQQVVARQVVLAPGPWLAAPAWRELVAPLGARVKKIVALHVERRPEPGDRAIVFQEEDAFLLPLHEEGYWLFSHTCRQWDVDPDALNHGLSDRDLRDALAELRALSPEFAKHCDSGRVFCDAYSGTGEPLVRTLPADPRLVFAGAANGSGYRLAPAIAAQAADLLNLPSTPGSHRDHQ